MVREPSTRGIRGPEGFMESMNAHTNQVCARCNDLHHLGKDNLEACDVTVGQISPTERNLCETRTGLV